MEFELRQAEISDLDRLEPLVRDYHDFEQIGSNEVERRSAPNKLLGDSTPGGIWLIYIEKDLAGYIVLCRGFSLEFNGFDAFIDEFYLQPAYRGRGIGAAVLDEIKNQARDRQINSLHLEVARDNARACRLYAGSGFEPREKYLLMSTDLIKNADPD